MRGKAVESFLLKAFLPYLQQFPGAGIELLVFIQVL